MCEVATPRLWRWATLLVKRGLEHYADKREVSGGAENFLWFTGLVWLGMEGTSPVRHVHKWYGSAWKEHVPQGTCTSDGHK